MPAIPLYQQTTSAQGTIDAQANPDDFGAQVGQAGTRIAAGLQDVAVAGMLQRRDNEAKLKEFDERLSQTAASDALTTFQLNRIDQMQTLKDQAGPGAFGFANKVASDFATAADAVRKQTETLTPNAKQYVNQRLNQMKVQEFEHAVTFQGQQTTAYNIDLGVKTIDGQAVLVAQNPAYYSQAMNNVENAISEQHPEVQSKLRDRARTALTAAAASSAIQTDPAHSYDALFRSLHPSLSPTVADGAGGDLASTDGTVAGSSPERGLRLNNPGNLRKTDTPWQGETLGSDPAFSGFATPEAGIRALGKNLLAYQDAHGINTVQGIVSRWAPATENNTSSYVANVSRALGVAPDAAIDVHDPKTLTALTTAIIQQENGKQPYKPDTIQAGVNAALGVSSLPAASPNSTAAVVVPALASISDTPEGEPVKTGVPWVDNMTVPERLHFLQQASTEQQRGLAGLQSALKAKERDLNAMVLSGVAPPTSSVPTERDYLAAYGQVDGPQLYRDNVLDLVHLGDGIRAMQTASPIERAAMITAATPRPGAGFEHEQRIQSALMKANEIVTKQITDDPADYAMRTSPQVQAAAKALEGGQGDPVVTMAYVNATNAEQTRLGVGAPDSPGSKFGTPKLLTVATANAIAQRFFDQSQGGANAANLIAQLEQQWGPAWPQVAGQLMLDNKLPPAVNVIANMPDKGARERLTSWSTLGDKKLEELLPAGVKREDVHQKLQSAFVEAMPSFVMQGASGMANFDNLMSQARTLSMGYISQGKSVGDATSQAFKDVLGQYTFESTYRIPTAEMPAQVSRGVASISDAARTMPVQIPPGVPGLTDKAREAAYRDVLLSRGVMMTNRDESGVNYMVQGQDGSLYAVSDPTGKAVQFTWKQLRDAGTAADKARAEAPLNQQTAEAQRSRMLQETAEQDRQRRLRQMGMPALAGR